MNKTEKHHYIFDFDGTLVDSMEIWAGTHIRMLRKARIAIPQDYVQTITPLGNEGAAMFSFSLGVNMPLSEYMRQVNNALIKQYSSRVGLKNNVAVTLKRLKEKGCSLHVLTASPHLYVDPCLERLGLKGCFENIWTVEDFGSGKGDVGIYKKAAKRLDTEIKNCTMVDDNYLALCAARKAGMNTIGIYDKSSKDAEGAIRETVDRYIYDFCEM